MTSIPHGENGVPIPALALKKDGAHALTVTSASSVRNATAFDKATKVVSVYSTAPVFLQFGKEGATASSADHYFPNGLYYDFAVENTDTYIAAIAVSADATVYISEKA